MTYRYLVMSRVPLIQVACCRIALANVSVVTTLIACSPPDRRVFAHVFCAGCNATWWFTQHVLPFMPESIAQSHGGESYSTCH